MFNPQMTDDPSPALMSLSASVELSPRDVDLIEGIQRRRQTFDAKEVVIKEGDFIEDCFILQSGWVGRRRTTFEGRSVMTNVYLPGDVVAPQLGFRKRSLFEVVALTETEVAVVSLNELYELVEESPVIAGALDWNLVRAFNIVSEHIVGVTTLYAQERVLHLFLEHWCRLMIVGQASESRFELPLTQAEIGEVVGLSTVSVNKAIAALRESGIVTTDKSDVVIHDIREAMDYCKFDAAFLEAFLPRGRTDVKALITALQT